MKVIIILAFLFVSSITHSQKKIFYIDSYNKDYSWSNDILKGIKSVLEDKQVELKVFYLDTKKPNYKSFIDNKVKDALTIIKIYQPDLIIAADDNASKYIISKHFKDSKIPVIFCGINWDASIYGYPYENTTGMVEVAPVDLLLRYLFNYSKGTRVGLIYAESITSKKDAIHIIKTLKINVVTQVSNDIKDFERDFINLQNKVDVIIIGNLATMKGYNIKTLKNIVSNNISVPTGTLSDFVTELALIGFTKIGEEQGEWVAQTALKIFDGMKPNYIDIVKNKRGRLYINLRLAEKLNIEFPDSHIKSAHKIIE